MSRTLFSSRTKHQFEPEYVPPEDPVTRIMEIISSLELEDSPTSFSELCSGTERGLFFIRKVLEMDNGDDQGHKMLTRYMISNLGSQVRRALFVEIASSLELLSLIQDLIAPINEQERKRYARSLNLAKYISKTFGESFIADLLYIIEIDTLTVNEEVRAWIEKNIRAKYSSRPGWIITSEKASPNVLVGWKVGADFNLNKSKYKDKIKHAVKFFEDSVEYDYGDCQDYIYPVDHDSEEFQLIHLIQAQPKRSINHPCDISPDLVFGPLNNWIDRECDGVELDGCRMLTCECWIEEENSGWFTGYCDVCFIAIRSKQFALRYPEVQGGWRGCFCCSECMMQDDGADGERVEHALEALGQYGIVEIQI